MLSLTAILLIGFLLGMRHATDPDHVVAITTIIARQPELKKAGFIGVLWGIGHTCTVFVVGAMIIVFRVTIPPRVGLSMEFAVAAMLIILGILNLTGTLKQLQERFLINSFPKDAAANLKVGNSNRTLDRTFQGLGAYAFFRPLFVGIVHGLAGSAAVALLVMATMHDAWSAIAYLLLFGLGTIIGMVLITMLIAMPFLVAGRRFSGLNRGMTIASALISMGFGLFLSVQIAYVDGLFSSHVSWKPH